METKASQCPKPPPPPKAPAKDQRDFLFHLEAYLAKRDGVDKLLKIFRYATKIILASTFADSLPVAPRLKSFESSVGISRKAFRLGKFVQDLNALRSSAVQSQSTGVRVLSLIAYGGEGVNYFVEQFVWLSTAGLIGSDHSKRLQKISAWAELVGHVGSIALKVTELKRIQSSLQSKFTNRKSVDGDGITEDDDEVRKLQGKLLLKELSIVQDLADALMAVGGLRDGGGFLSNPLVLASAGLLSALISTHKNWSSC